MRFQQSNVYTGAGALNVPIYSYTCTTCNQEVEKRQSFTDPPLTTCERCGGTLRKIIHPVGIVFKGSGWYSTDSRKSNSASTSSASEGSNSKSSNGTESKPAESKPSAESSASTPATE
jgi:putative FmdB family regulatory protein